MQGRVLIQLLAKVCSIFQSFVRDDEYNREAYEQCALQMEGMEQTQSTDHDAMYANGYPEVGLDQDASVHLNDVRSHIAALKVHISQSLLLVCILTVFLTDDT